MTKRNYLETIVYFFENGEFAPEVEVDETDVIDFCKHEIELIDIKNEKSRAKSSATAKKNDELAQKILSVLTVEPQTIAQVVAVLDDEDTSAAKVTYRLAALAKDGTIGKVQVDVGEKKMCAYHLIVD